MMSNLDRLLGIVGMGSTIASVSLLRRFLTGMTVVIGLTAICGTMAGMLLMVMFYGLFTELVHYGLEPVAAFMTVSGLILVLLVALASTAFYRWRELKTLPDRLASPVVGEAGKLIEAFMDGFHKSRRS